MAKDKVFLIPPPRMTSISSSVHNVYFIAIHANICILTIGTYINTLALVLDDIII